MLPCVTDGPASLCGAWTVTSGDARAGVLKMEEGLQRIRTQGYVQVGGHFDWTVSSPVAKQCIRGVAMLAALGHAWTARPNGTAWSPLRASYHVTMQAGRGQQVDWLDRSFNQTTAVLAALLFSPRGCDAPCLSPWDGRRRKRGTWEAVR